MVVFHKTLDAGKKLYIGADNTEQLLALKKEFGKQCKGFLINMWASTPRQAQEYLQTMEF